MNKPFTRIGEFLKQSRVDAGFSQTDIAKKFKYEQQFVSNWERGISSPPLRTLKALVKLYKVSLDDAHQLLLDDSIERVKEDLAKALKRA